MDNKAVLMMPSRITLGGVLSNDRLHVEEINSDGDPDIERTTTYEYGGPANLGTQQTKKTVTGDVSEVTTYAYNLQGRLSQVVVDLGADGLPESTSSYKYNDAGHRVSQAVNGQTTLYVVDANNHTGYSQVLEEGIDDNGNGRLNFGEIDKTYTLGHDVIAQQGPLIDSGQPLYLAYDGHGSTRAFVRPSGTIVQRYVYDAYGNMLPGAGLTVEPASALTSLLYSGEQVEGATGLGYNRERVLDFGTGRFLTLDPYAGSILDPLSLHKYLYVHGNPVMGVDPSGLFEGLASVAVANSIAGTLASIQGEAGQFALNVTDAVLSGISAQQAIFANIIIAATILDVAPILSGALSITERFAGLLLNRASGLLFEARAARWLADFAGETIIKTKFLRGAVDRGVDFASISGTGQNARLIFNEVRNVRGLVRNETFTAFGLGTGNGRIWRENLLAARRAVETAHLDRVTRDTILSQLNRKEIVIRVIGSGAKRTEFQSDLLIQLRQATGFDVALDFLYTIE